LNNAIIGIKAASGKKIIAKYIIDASGGGNVSGKILGLKQHFYSPPLICWSGKITGISANEMPDNRYTQFIKKNKGWQWIAPEDNGNCSFTCLSLKGDEKFQVPEIIQGKGSLQKIVKFNMRWRSYEKVAIEGLFLCGDAGMIIDPAAGQGILNAIYSGIKASEAIASSLNQPEKEDIFLKNYSEWFNNESIRKVELLKEYYHKQEIKIFEQ